MNWLVLVVVLLLAWNMVMGYKKGLLRVIYTLVEWLLIGVFVVWASPYVANMITEYTKIPEYIEAHCIEKMKSSVEAREDMLTQIKAENEMEEMTGDLANLSIGELLNNLSNPDDERLEGFSTTDLGEKLAMFGIALPDNMTESIFSSSSDAIDSALVQSGNFTEALIEKSGIYEVIAKKITELAINGLSYFITLMLAIIIFHLIGNVLDCVTKIPVLGRTNQILGFFAGALEGLVIVWIVFAIIAACAGTTLGRFVIPYIAESPLLVWLYQNNMIVGVLLAFLFK